MSAPDDCILVGDIGATHARLALAAHDGTLDGVERYPIAEIDNARSLLARYLDDKGNPPLGGACLALAGPVLGSRVTLVNAPVTFDAGELGAQLGGVDVHLINDFAAVATALPVLGAAWLRQLGGGEPGPGVKAAIGPGTGLGMGLLVPHADGWLVSPSEGGHAGFAPADLLETEILTLLLREHDYVSWETLLTGSGLVRLHRAVCELWGCDAALDVPAEITARALDGSDPVAHQSLETFCAMLGSAAGGLALTAGATGGVYLAGGIVPRILDFLAASHFRVRFEQHGPLSDYCRRIPAYAITDPDVGLRGAAASFRAHAAG